MIPHAVSFVDAMEDRGRIVISTHLDREGEIMGGVISTLARTRGVIIALRRTALLGLAEVFPGADALSS